MITFYNLNFLLIDLALFNLISAELQYMLCLDLSNEASEPWGVCSCKNYLKTCQDATARALVSRLSLCLLYRLPVCFFKLLQQVKQILDKTN